MVKTLQILLFLKYKEAYWKIQVYSLSSWRTFVTPNLNKEIKTLIHSSKKLFYVGQSTKSTTFNIIREASYKNKVFSDISDVQL